MNVWWAGGSVHAFICKKLGELAREEFTSVIAVEGAHHSSWSIAPLVEEGGESGEKKSDVLGSLVFVL
eukprot:1904572-Pleurochrysis_carterae.AAC.1